MLEIKKGVTANLFDFDAEKQVFDDFASILRNIEKLNIDDKVDAINTLREMIHAISPFNSEPVDFVKWVKNEDVHANDYNPNSVAPPEMELLKTSISHDGYTQPIVSMLDENSTYEVIDGFHRHKVGKYDKDIQGKVHGYLPLVQIRTSQSDRNDRIASTIRHNRARGEHKVDSMSEIVIELKRRFWSDDRIAKELGMEQDEVLRLQQVSGLIGLFADAEFSMAWVADRFDDVEGDDDLTLS